MELKYLKKRIFPAHYRIEDNEVQTVEEHVKNVEDKARKYGYSIGLSNTCGLAGLLHDMGKFTDEFCDYFWRSVSQQAYGQSVEKGTVPHGRHGAIMVMERYHKGSIYEKITAEILAMTICYHHGGMEDFLSPDLTIKLKEKTENKDERYQQALNRFLERVCGYEELDALFHDSVNEIERIISQIIKNKEINNMFSIHLLVKYVYSCLIDADRYDTYLFMSKADEKSEIDYKELWMNFSDHLSIREKSFLQKEHKTELEEKIAGLRNDILEQCRTFSVNPSGIYTLTVPTGGGKTLSSLRYAIEHAIEYEKKHIMYILPFTTIIEQNAEEVRSILEAKEYLLEHHSNVLAEGEEDDDEFRRKYRLLTEQWDSPIIFTTMVQFLNTFFASGTQSMRRMHNISDSIIIFDEIQALPVKCISMFNETVKFLSEFAQNTVLLCTATQPLLHKVKNPLKVDGEIIEDMIDKFHQFKRVEVLDKREKKKFTYDRLIDFIDEQIQAEVSILIILNTKITAENVFKKLKKQHDKTDLDLYYLSTNLCPLHRKENIAEIKERLKEGKKLICVSTQLIEAGVDISFSCVIRHIAGMDSIAQAAGRGNRHGECETKYAYIFELEDEKLGNLDEIALGEKHTEELLDIFKNAPEKFENELLSPMAMERYYSLFLNDKKIQEKLDYPVETNYGQRKLFEMLSAVKEKSDYEERYGTKFPLEMAFQLKTAAKYFQVIDECSISVLVPYNEGKTFILELNGQARMEEKKKMIRKAQQYMVNLSQGVFEQLKRNGGIVFNTESEIWSLNEEFYDEELGVVVEGRKMKALVGY